MLSVRRFVTHPLQNPPECISTVFSLFKTLCACDQWKPTEWNVWRITAHGHLAPGLMPVSTQYTPPPHPPISDRRENTFFETLSLYKFSDVAAWVPWKMYCNVPCLETDCYVYILQYDHVTFAAYKLFTVIFFYSVISAGRWVGRGR